MRRRIVIIHFQPVELYPPVQNLINFLGAKTNQHEISVITTKAGNKIPGFQTENIKILRFGRTQRQNSFMRYLNYGVFYFFSLIYLLRVNPDRIFYFETLSSYPAFLYKKWVGKKTELLIHYHEYTSPAEILQGMALNKIFHAKEKKLYPDALWVSHTNEFRMALFQKDEYPVSISHAHILPNYPPASWQVSQTEPISEPLKIVMVGALGLDTMYVKEFAEWIIRQQGGAVWDIYSFTITEEVRSYLASLQTRFITVKASVAYKNLPEVLKNYNVGVILYKGHIPNYVFNAPNKLFEYHVNGLDVWFPEQMSGMHKFIKVNSYPKVVPVKFEQMEFLTISDLIKRDGLKQIIEKYSSESALEELGEILLNE